MKEYRNAVRTKKWIRQAFMELVSEKQDIDKISVTELAERADISKTTFYYHYEDIYSVAEEMENELISAIAENLEGIERSPEHDYGSQLRAFLGFLKKNEPVYRLMIRCKGFSYFSGKLKKILATIIEKNAPSLPFSRDENIRAVQLCFLTSACVDVVVEYFRGGFDLSLDEVGDVVIEAMDKLQRKEQ